MNKLIKVAVDAMGGDNAPQKIIDGIELHHKTSKNTFYRLFGNKNIIEPAINKKTINNNYQTIKEQIYNLNQNFIKNFEIVYQQN